MSEPLLYGPDGRPVDRRTEQQREFDRRLRQQMGDNSGVFFPRRFITAIQREFEHRPKFEAPQQGESFAELFRDRD